MTSEVPTVTGLRIYRSLGGPELHDGDAFPLMTGGQGASHVGFELELDGSGFSDCAQVLITVDETDVFSGGIRVRDTATGARTTQLAVFPPITGGCQTVTATAYGVTRVLRLGMGCAPAPDAGPDAAACGDGIVQAGEECDLADPAVCRADCTLEECDGVAIAGESCFVPDGTYATDTVLAMTTRATSAGQELVTGVITIDGAYALELHLPTLELVASYPLPFEPGAIVSVDRDGDGFLGDVVVLSADGSRFIEGRAGGAAPLTFMTEVSLTPSASLSLPMAACALDGPAVDDVIVATSESIQRLASAPSVWLPRAGGPIVGLACRSVGTYSRVFVATESYITIYQQVPDGTVEQVGAVSATRHDRLTYVAPADALFGLGTEPELFDGSANALGVRGLPPTARAAWALRDGWTVLGLVDEGRALSFMTVSRGAVDAYAQPAGSVASDIVGLEDGSFITHDGGLLYRWVPSA